MNLDYANVIGFWLEDLIQFVVNLAPGYILILILLFLGGLIVIYFRFFANVSTHGLK